MMNNVVTTEGVTKIQGAQYVSGIVVENDIIMAKDAKLDNIDVSEEVVKLTDNIKFGKNKFDFELKNV